MAESASVKFDDVSSFCGFDRLRVRFFGLVCRKNFTFRVEVVVGTALAERVFDPLTSGAATLLSKFRENVTELFATRLVSLRSLFIS